MIASLLICGLFLACVACWIVYTGRKAVWPKPVRLIMLAALALSIPLYFSLSSVTKLDAIEQKQAELKQLRSQIRDLEMAVKANPKDTPSWLMLGQSLAAAQQFDAAADAFKHALVLSGGNAKIMVVYAKTLILAAQGEVTDKAKDALRMVLMLEPGQPDAEYYTGLGEVQQGDFASAQKRWMKARDALPKNSEFRRHIEDKLSKLAKRM